MNKKRLYLLVSGSCWLLLVGFEILVTHMKREMVLAAAGEAADIWVAMAYVFPSWTEVIRRAFLLLFFGWVCYLCGRAYASPEL